MILFLDFDGVLHPMSMYLEKVDLLMWAPLLIEALEPHPHVEIVLSTSWVRSRGVTRTLEYLPEDLRKRVVGATFDPALFRTCRYDAATRFEQIAQYAERANLSRWIAIDDLHEGSELQDWDDAHQDKLILTDPLRGLSDPAAQARLLTLLRESK